MDSTLSYEVALYEIALVIIMMCVNNNVNHLNDIFNYGYIQLQSTKASSINENLPRIQK